MIANREMSLSSQTFEQVVQMKKMQLKRVAETISQSDYSKKCDRK